MDKKTWLAGAALILLSAGGIALAQSHNRVAQPGESASQASAGGANAAIASWTDMSKVHATPAQEARFREMCRLDQAAKTAMAAGDYIEAEADARKSIATLPESGLAQNILAASLYAQGKTKEALEAYKTIADKGGDEPKNLLPYALLLLNAGHYAQAVWAYNKALPTLGDILPRQNAENATGDSLMEINSHFTPGNPQPKDLETAIHIAMGLTRGGACSLGSGSQDDKMLAQFKQAVSLEPNSALAHLYYAAKLRDMRREVEATAEFKKAAALGSGVVKAVAVKAGR